MVVPEDYAGLRLDQALCRLLPEYSRSRLQHWVREGHVKVMGESATPNSKVWGGEHITVQPQPDAAQLAFRPEPIHLQILYEDEAILVIDKPAGLVVHPGSGHWSGTMLNALLQHAPALGTIPRAGIVHRLDKSTSGLLVVAKTLTAQTALVRQLQARQVGREYLAMVHGAAQSHGIVHAPIGRHPRNRIRMAVVAKGKPATTRYEVAERGDQWSCLRCWLETGRTHQIRVHLSSIGHPLIGDPLYRAPSVSPALPEIARTFSRQALHAARLTLTHPVKGQLLSWTSALPADLQDLLDA
ncbi:MAG: RluA family pseudouridine synthase, partial [Burkholderiales bacterium]